MSCSFAHDDAAYVLGALGPAERLAFERHLDGCAECTRSVRGLAGLPGLLSRVDREVLEEVTPELTHDLAPVPGPDTLLAATARAARRARRWRTAVTAATAAAAAAVVTALVVPPLTSGDPDSGAPDVVAGSHLQMAQVGDVPVEADLALQQVTWGTRLELTCTYDTGLVRYSLPPAVDYVLVVQTRDGHVERVGSWRSVDGRTMQLSAGTAATPSQIKAVEVRTPDGRIVLTAAV
jgi:hypothetical protein